MAKAPIKGKEKLYEKVKLLEDYVDQQLNDIDDGQDEIYIELFNSNRTPPKFPFKITERYLKELSKQYKLAGWRYVEILDIDGYYPFTQAIILRRKRCREEDYESSSIPFAQESLGSWQGGWPGG